MTALSLVTLLAAAAAGATPPDRPARPPNIVFLLADDLGYGDLGCTGHPYAKTPEIDRLAADGTLFRRFYVAGATCCPSRTGFMTGRFPAGFAKYPAGFGFGGALTVGDLLKRRGYATGHFGKWHLGPQDKPGTYGLDEIKVLGGNHKDIRGRDAEIADEAIRFIRARKDGPFFLNVWFRSTHNPVNPPASFAAKFKDLTLKPGDFPNPDQQAEFATYKKLGGDLDAGMRNYVGEVLQLDGQVGRILKTLDELGLRDDTVVIFSSDNGPAQCASGNPKRGKEYRLHENMLGSAGAFRERKHSLHDGGIHLPLIVRWPGRTPAGKTDDRSVVAGIDFPATLAAIAGADTAGAAFDGEDVSDVWAGRPRDRRKDLFWKASNPKGTPTMLRGHWKLHLPARGPAELYDLATDPGERKDVSAAHPEVVRELSAVLRRWNASLPTSYEKGDDNED